MTQGGTAAERCHIHDLGPGQSFTVRNELHSPSNVTGQPARVLVTCAGLPGKLNSPNVGIAQPSVWLATAFVGADGHHSEFGSADRSRSAPSAAADWLLA